MSILIITGIAGTLIAILPAFIIFFYIARFKGRMWLSAVLGGVFWFIALLARTPILAGLELLGIFITSEMLLVYLAIIIFLAALMAGLFEEGIKYLFLKRQPKWIETTQYVLCFGLGWGLGEAFLIYVIDVLAYAFLYPFLSTIISLPPEYILAQNFLIGAVERNIAIVFHVSATILIALAVWHKKLKFLWLAIFVHFLFDFIPLIILQFLLYPILGSTLTAVLIVETLFAVYAVIFAVLAFYLWKWEKVTVPLKLETESI
ncbi:MAG: YhfC family glutamic-type intramembrane protease [Candidatus Thorarchaeota archaeon]